MDADDILMRHLASQQELALEPALDVAGQIQLAGGLVTVFDPEAMTNARERFPTLNYATSAEACPTYDGRPSMTLRLAPGYYPMITKYDEAGGIAGLSDAISVSPYFEPSMCLFVTRNT